MQKLSLIEDYFENIDTTTKAYWLGVLYSDGNVTRNHRQIRIEVSKRDIWLLEKIKTDLNIGSAISSTKKGKLLCLYISRKRMVEDLIGVGCIPCKSKVIELPILSNRSLYLAFLLGFYDGDGTQNSTRITCGNRKFLEQIKLKFGLSFIIGEKNNGGFIGTRKITGVAYCMSLGAPLFNEMMGNYKNSLPRKRNYFSTKEERARKAAEASRENTGKEKFYISKGALKNLVWQVPATEIAKRFGVSSNAIAKRCERLGIEKPSRGYWAKVNAKNVSTPL